MRCGSYGASVVLPCYAVCIVSDSPDIIEQTFLRLGISPDQTRIYRYLLGKLPQSALAISRALTVPRTRVYRILDKLLAVGLVEQTVGPLGIVFRATDMGRLERLVADRETELAAIKQSLPIVCSSLSKTSGSDAGRAAITYHTGLPGLKHVTWNSLDAKKDLYIIEKATDMTAFVDREFAEEYRRELVRRKIMVWQLTTIPHIAPWTDVPDCVKWWKVRYIDKKLLPVVCESIVYNDVYAMYTWDKTEAFAVEITNHDVAVQQKILFQFLWTHARPMKIIGKRGEAKIA